MEQNKLKSLYLNKAENEKEVKKISSSRLSLSSVMVISAILLNFILVGWGIYHINISNKLNAIQQMLP